MASAIRALGGTVFTVAADLSDATTPARLFDAAEAEIGPVDILINNASAWVADTFRSQAGDHFGHRQVLVAPDTIDRQFAVDARGSALLIAEFAHRHEARGAAWGRIVGLTSGSPTGFPNEVSYGAAKAARR